MDKKKGKQTIVFEKQPYIVSSGTVVGNKEGQGPLAKWFDVCLEDDMYGEKSWEKGESKMLKEAFLIAIKRSGLDTKDIDIALSGDLVNQIMSSSFMARDLKMPFLGIYGACSTMTESLLLGCMLLDGGFANNIATGASSHFCTAERQFRLPVEHGNQKPPSAQWTVTGAGALVTPLSPGQVTRGGVLTSSGVKGEGRLVRATCGTIGKVMDAGVTDVNQMGAAMAPAAVDTILNHLQDTGRNMDYYDLVLTGDLGKIGKAIAKDLFVDAGIDKQIVDKHYDDCGTIIYDMNGEKHSGGSGCGCSGSVFAGKIFKEMQQGKIEKVLLVSTGALISTISSFQGESIPGIAHAVAVEVE